MSDDREDETQPLAIEQSSGGQANADLAAGSAPADRKAGEDMAERQEQLIDEAVQESFPASDPVSPKQIT